MNDLMIRRLHKDFEIVIKDDVIKIENKKNNEINENIGKRVAVVLKLFDGVRTNEDVKKIILSLSENDNNWIKLYSQTIEKYGHLLQEVKEDEIKKRELFTIEDILNFKNKEKNKPNILHRRMVPTKLMWIISNQCVRRCKYCYLTNKTKLVNKLEENVIPNEKIKTLAKECRDLGIKEIVFSGGDPLTCKNIYEICNLFLSNDLYVTVITKMKIEYAQVVTINEKKLNFMFSLDSVIDETADELAGYIGHCKEMKENFLLCDNLNIRYSISITVCKTNFDEIFETVTTLMKNFNGNIVISKYNSFGDDNSIYKIEYEKYADLCRKLIFYVKDQNCESRLLINSLDYDNKKPCDAGREKMVIDSRGNTIMCEKIFQSQETENVFENGILEVWNSDAYKGMFGLCSNNKKYLNDNVKWKCPIKCESNIEKFF